MSHGELLSQKFAMAHDNLHSLSSQTQRVLYIVVCAAVPARHLQDFVTLVQDAYWDVYIIATPNATAFINQALLTQLTGHPVFTDDLATPLPPCTALVVVPATFNTLKKWAQGVVDNFALAYLATTFNLACPVLAIPRASPELAQDPAFYPCLISLQQRGVHILYDPIQYPPNNDVSWESILAELHHLLP